MEEKYTYEVPSRDLFLQSKIQDNFCETDDTNNIASKVNKLFRTNELSNDQKNVLGFICRLTSSYIELEGKNYIYKPICTFHDGTRSIIPDDFTNDELDLIDSLVDDIRNPFLKARMADIVWFKKYGDKKNCVKRARQYVDIYLGIDIDGEIFISHEKEFRRAISVAKSIKYDYSIICKFKEKLILEIPKCEYQSVGIPCRIFDLIEIAPDKKDYQDILTHVSNKIQNAKVGEKYWSTDIHYLELKDKCLKRLSTQHEPTKEIILNLLDIAKRYEAEIETCENRKDYLNAKFHCENAIKTYRSIPKINRSEYNVDDKISELLSKKQQMGVASIGNMKVTTNEIKIPEGALTDALNRVSGKKFPDVLFWYQTITRGFPNIDNLKKMAEDEVCNGKNLSDLFPKIAINSLGRIAGRQDGMDISSEESKAEKIKSRTIEIYFRYLSWIYLPILLQSFYKMINEHRISLDNILDLCLHSSIIPRDRIYFWAKGLYAGFNQDFDVATHLLIPQIEHFVRLKMINEGINTCVIDTDGSENEKSLSTLLEQIEKLDDQKLFSAEDFFELKAMFGNFPSANMRNIISHGLLDDFVHDGECIYIWYFSLCLVLRSIPIKKNE